jgi:cytoskeleton protein RodZ
MAGLGTYLNQLREERGPSIDELARLTRVASRYLEALERDDLDALPAPVFTKGYIRAYCQALGVPADEALARYSDAVKVPTVNAAAAVPATRAAEDAHRARGTLLLSFALLVGFGAALFGVALFLQSGRPDIAARAAVAPAPKVEVAVTTPAAPTPSAPAPSTEPTPEVPATTAASAAPAPDTAAAPPAAAPAPTATPVPAATPVAPTAPAAPTAAPPVPAAVPPAPARTAVASPPPAAPTPKPTVAADARPAAADAKSATVIVDPPPLQLAGVISPYRLVARTVEATWLRVRTDDGRATEETIPAGEVREWISNRPFIVTIGNAAGVALELNGQKLPPLGARGAVISRMILPPAEP